jgi:hypothetical protein
MAHRICVWNQTVHAYEQGGRLLQFDAFGQPPLQQNQQQQHQQLPESPIKQMLDFLLDHGPRDVTTLALAHNAGKYDLHLVLAEVYQSRPQLRPRITMTGSKVYCLILMGNHQRRVIFKDSVNFFLARLASLPKAFGLQGCEAKPFFPYKWTRRGNLDRVLPGLPPSAWYEPDWMMPDDRERFLHWHVQEHQRLLAETEHAGGSPRGFHLRKQLVVYCRNDVAILRAACVCFRRLLLERCAVDPFVVAMTVAGLALKVFRYHHLPKDCMAHTPEGGMRRGHRGSAEALRYMHLWERMHPEHRGQVQTAEWQMGEATVEDCGYRLDGLVYRTPPLRPLAIEYMGYVLLLSLIFFCMNVLYYNIFSIY